METWMEPKFLLKISIKTDNFGYLIWPLCHTQCNYCITLYNIAEYDVSAVSQLAVCACHALQLWNFNRKWSRGHQTWISSVMKVDLHWFILNQTYMGVKRLRTVGYDPHIWKGWLFLSLFQNPAWFHSWQYSWFEEIKLENGGDDHSMG